MRRMTVVLIGIWLLAGPVSGQGSSGHDLICRAGGETLRFQGFSARKVDIQKQEYLNGSDQKGIPLRAQIWQVTGTAADDSHLVELIFLKGKVLGVRHAILSEVTTDHPILHAKGQSLPCQFEEQVAKPAGNAGAIEVAEDGNSLNGTP